MISCIHLLIYKRRCEYCLKAESKPRRIETITMIIKRSSYPTKKPAKCSSKTESNTTPRSPDNIDWMKGTGEEPGGDEAPTIEDLRRTTFSEKMLG